MLQHRLNQGISSGCHHSTPKTIFLELSLLWEVVLCFCFDLAKVLLQGATMLPLHSIFFEVIIMGRGICFCFNLDNVFLQSATMPPLHPIFFLEVSLLWEGGITLPLRLSQRNSSGCHHAKPKPQIYLELSFCGKGHYAFAST